MDAAVLHKVAHQLPDNDRALLADSLLASISPTPSDIEGAWVREADERLRAFRMGEMDAVDGPAAMAGLRVKLPR